MQSHHVEFLCSHQLNFWESHEADTQHEIGPVMLFGKPDSGQKVMGHEGDGGILQSIEVQMGDDFAISEKDEGRRS